MPRNLIVELADCLRVVLATAPLRDCPTLRERCQLATAAVEHDPSQPSGFAGMSPECRELLFTEILSCLRGRHGDLERRIEELLRRDLRGEACRPVACQCGECRPPVMEESEATE